MDDGHRSAILERITRLARRLPTSRIESFCAALEAVFALTITFISPLPARVTPWSVGVAVVLGASVGLIFGVYPARRAARLDPVVALGHE